MVDEINRSGGSAEPLIIDLSSLDSVRSAVADLEDRGRTVDVLINNAGIGMSRGVTPDGFEINFGVNHLGPFLFTRLLQRSFRPGTRIITVSSAMHYRVDDIDFAKLRRPSASFFGIHDYAVSKLANILFMSEMARRQSNWTTYSVHPGFVDTGIIRSWAKPFIRGRLITPEEGAETTIWCATEPSLSEESGNYYTRCAQTTPSATASDESLARELWEQSDQWSGMPAVS